MFLAKKVGPAVGAAAVALGTLGAAIIPTTVSAQPPENVQVGGAAGLVAAVVGVQDVQVIDDIDVRLEDINVIRNVLNNSQFLNNNDIEVNVLTIENALNNNVVTLDDLVDLNVDIDDVVAVVQVLGGGVLVLT